MLITFFVKYRPSHSTTGERIATRIAALTPSMKKNYYGYKFGELWSSNPTCPCAHDEQGDIPEQEKEGSTVSSINCDRC